MTDIEISPELLLEFALADITEALDETDDQSDAQLAYALYREDLLAATVLLADRRLAMGVTGPTASDQDVIFQALNEEQQAARDRRVALHLEQTGQFQAGTEVIPSTSTVQTMLPSTLEAVRALASPLETLDTPRGAVSYTITHICVVCDGSFPKRDTLKAQCQHRYCMDCLTILISRCTLDEELFPPRCCKQPLNLDDVRRLLRPELIELLEAKTIEFTTSNRIYCSNPTCSAFIRPELIYDQVGTCPLCSTKTCIVCKRISHDGQCPDDLDVKLLHDLAVQEGWQQCFQCKRLVSIAHGCNHMICLCKAQWCYECAQEWRTCTCALFREDRLIDEAHRVLRARQEEINADTMGQEARRILANHDCTHECGFSYERVRSLLTCRCAMCHWQAPIFLQVCDECGLQLCEQCRRNRL